MILPTPWPERRALERSLSVRHSGACTDRAGAVGPIVFDQHRDPLHPSGAHLSIVCCEAAAQALSRHRHEGGPGGNEP